MEGHGDKDLDYESVIGSGGEGLELDSMKGELDDLITEKAKEIGIKYDSQVSVLDEWLYGGAIHQAREFRRD